MIQALQYATAAGFCVLAGACVSTWMRYRDRARGYIALAVSLLALVAVLGQVGRLTDYRFPVLGDVAIVAFVASGYFFVMFRHAFVPLSRVALSVVTVAMLAIAGAALAAGLPYADAPRYNSTENAIVAGVVLVWVACILEPIARFWLASRGQPAVQRARLRSLSLAYAGIAFILVVAIVVHPARESALSIGIQIVALAFVPLLFASLVPPPWLRRLWSQREEDDLHFARDLLTFSRNRQLLAERMLHWAMRVVGAQAGFIGNENAVLARHGVDDADVRRVASSAPSDGAARMTRLEGHPPRYAITVPVPSQTDATTLAVLSGAYTPLFGSDEVSRLQHHAAIIGVALDRVHLVEELERIDVARREFLANAAHELRSPLTTIVGISSTLSARSDAMDAAKWRSGIEAVNRQGQRMRTLINNLLDLSQMEQGRLKVDVSAVAVADAARDTLETSPPPDGVTVDVAIEPSLKVMADPVRLDQILTNLLTNAYRYGGARISMEAFARNGSVIVAVCDDGPGVPHELVPHVFDPFARGTNGKKEGSGLGLAIVKLLSQAFGGDVTYEPGRPQGARFFVHLRRAE